MAASLDVLDDWKSIFNEKVSDTEELIACVKEILPFQSENIYEVISVKGTTDTFKTTIGCALKTDEDVQNFKKNFYQLIFYQNKYVYLQFQMFPILIPIQTWPSCRVFYRKDLSMQLCHVCLYFNADSSFCYYGNRK